MDNFGKFLENLVSECLKSDKLAFLPDKEKKEIEGKIRNHFNDVTINTLVEQLTDEQVNQIKALDPKDPKVQELMAQFAAGIPGFAFVLEERLKKEMDSILQSGQIPASAGMTS
ncbi:MAG: hypothetical protein AAB414_04390 [Patescibacteria group bacterium]